MMRARAESNFVTDAHRGEKRFVVRADEKLSAFVAEQRGVLEQAEQFEHDYDNNNYSDYVEDVSVHAVTNIRLGCGD